jgi:hypothetical protein
MASDRKLLSEAARRILARDPELERELRDSGIESHVAELEAASRLPAALESLDLSRPAAGELAFETIVVAKGLPVLQVKQNDIEITFSDPASEFWRGPLKAAHRDITGAIPAVGRIELQNHPREGNKRGRWSFSRRFA